MTGYVTYSLDLNRDGGTFDFYADYYVPGYDDPETGEQFYQTTWYFTSADVNAGTSYTAVGNGWDSGNAYISIGFPSGEDIADINLNLTATNDFSAVSTSMDWHILNAGLAHNAKTLIGGNIDDIIISGSGADTLVGNGGNDYLDGGAGKDQLEGGAGKDHLDGGIGADVLIGGADDDSYYVDNFNDKIIEDADGGHDVVFATVNYKLADNVEELYLVTAGPQNGTGNDQDNWIYGTPSSGDVLKGLGGNDRLDGGGGDDRMEGGKGDDTYVVSSTGDVIIEKPGEGTDIVRVFGPASYVLPTEVEDLINVSSLDTFHGIGNAKANTLTGSYNTDFLDGLKGDDTLDGYLGDDVLQGGLGADHLIGGLGFDMASYADAAGPVTVSLATGAGTRGEAIGDTFDSIEGLIGSAYADVLTGDSGNNRLVGGAGGDKLSGGLGDDWLQGGIGADVLIAGGGNDGVSYRGSVGAVQVDLLTQTASGGDAQGDTLYGIFLNAEGGDGNDTLSGNGQANLLIGGAGADTLDGRGGNDILRGEGGADVLTGGAGSEDWLSYSTSHAGVSIDLKAGTASGGDADGDTFSGIERVEGSAYDDHLTGDDGNNWLTGGDGNDVLLGGKGDDVINGGHGQDTMDGGEGNDTLSFAGSNQQAIVFLDSNYIGGGDAYGDTIANFENIIGSDSAVGDSLYGDSRDNVIHGGAGDDFLSGFGGTDRLFGDAGNDKFYFDSTVGTERVMDFKQNGDHDQIYMNINTGAFDTFAEVMAVAHTVGSDTVFDFGPHLQLVLVGVDQASLTSADFFFPEV